jgi:flagellar hook-basal body complex protein FliE
MYPIAGIGQGVPIFHPAATGPISVRELQEVPGDSVAPAQSSFATVLGRVVAEVNDKQLAAGEAVNSLLAGKNVSLHQAMIAMEEASVSFQLMVEVRNKLLESYQELMRMQI